MRDNLSQRPRVRIPRTGWDFAGEALALLGVVVGVLLPIVSWSEIPEEVPRHFLPTGEPTAWTGRWIIVALPILTVIFYVGLGLMQRIPHYFNYVVHITERNAPIQYRLARTMVLWLKATIAWMFVYIEWSTIRIAQGIDSQMHPAPMIALLTSIFGQLILYLYRAYKRREETTDDHQYERTY